MKRIGLRILNILLSPAWGVVALAVLFSAYYLSLLASGSLSMQGEFVLWHTEGEVYAVPDLLRHSPIASPLLYTYLTYLVVRWIARLISLIDARQPGESDPLPGKRNLAPVELEVPAHDLDVAALRKKLSQNWWQIEPDERGFSARKTHWGEYFGLCLSAGVIVFLTGVLLSTQLRTTSTLRVGEKTQTTPTIESINPYDWAAGSMELPGDAENDLAETSTQSFPGKGTLFELKDARTASASGGTRPKAEVTVRLEVSGRTRSETIEVKGYPPTRWRDSQLHLLDMGLAPGIIVQDGDTPLHTNFHAVEVFEYGNPVDVYISGLNVNVQLIFLPPENPDPGADYIRQLKAARIHLSIRKHGQVAYEGIVEQGEVIDLGGITFIIPTINVWSTVSLIRDPGLAPARVGLILILLGIPLLLFPLFSPGMQQIRVVQNGEEIEFYGTCTRRPLRLRAQLQKFIQQTPGATDTE